MLLILIHHFHTNYNVIKHYNGTKFSRWKLNILVSLVHKVNKLTISYAIMNSVKNVNTSSHFYILHSKRKLCCCLQNTRGLLEVLRLEKGDQELDGANHGQREFKMLTEERQGNSLVSPCPHFAQSSSQADWAESCSNTWQDKKPREVQERQNGIRQSCTRHQKEREHIGLLLKTFILIHPYTLILCFWQKGVIIHLSYELFVSSK